MLVQTVDSFIENNGIKLLLTGESGVGKTRSVKSLQNAGYKPLVISAESGVLSLAGSKMPMIDISRGDDKKEIPLPHRVERLYKVFDWLKAGQKEYDTVFLDSLTEVNQSLISYLRDVKHANVDASSKSLKVYGDNMEIMLKLVREFRDLPYNVVIVSLSEVEKDEVGRRFTTASVVGKVAQHLPALFDEVFNLQLHEDDKKNVVQKFQCRASSGLVCKDRSGKLDMFESYDLGKIFNKIKGVK